MSMTTENPAFSTPRKTPDRVRVSPRVDVYESENELLVVADVPGATKETLAVHVDKGQLTLEAHREPVAHGTLLEAEYRQFDYHRVFVVPEGIDASKIEAQLTAGVLRVRLPKSESRNPRRIDTKAS